MITAELESAIRSIVRDELAKRNLSKNEWMPKICNEVIAELNDEEWDSLVDVCINADMKTQIPREIDGHLLKKAALYLNSDLTTAQKHNIRANLKEVVRKITNKLD